MRKVFLKEDEGLEESVLERSGSLPAEVVTASAGIVQQVRERGDAALRELTMKFDGVDIDSFRVPQDKIDSAIGDIEGELAEAMIYAASRIANFHKRGLRQSSFSTDSSGVFLGTKITPLDSVGIYVPGGRAQYPSTVLMNAVAAMVAGVRRVVMCAPPSADGEIDAATLAAAHIAGVDEVYRVGGAQAIAAMAYGTESIRRVDKITGPGNAYVAAAKRCVSGDVGIDMIAGPSEVCVLADSFAQPEFIAIDLMAQAEHDPAARCYLVTASEELADEVFECIDEFCPRSPREEITRKSLEHALCIICPDIYSCIDAVNVIAPEHLEMQVTDPLELLGLIKHAGAIFLGEFTPESCGDYVAGPNHTLPTGGTARFSSPLSTDEFVKKSNVIQYTFNSLMRDASQIECIALREGLWSHARAVSLRREIIEQAIEDVTQGIEDDDCGCGEDDCSCDEADGRATQGDGTFSSGEEGSAGER